MWQRWWIISIHQSLHTKSIYSFISWPESGASPYIHWSPRPSQSIASPSFQSVCPSKGWMVEGTSGDCFWQWNSKSICHLVSVVHKSWHNFLHSALNQNSPHHPDFIIGRESLCFASILCFSIPEALSIAINPVKSLNDDVMFIEILLQLVRLGRDATLLLSYNCLYHIFLQAGFLTLFRFSRMSIHKYLVHPCVKTKLKIIPILLMLTQETYSPVDN